MRESSKVPLEIKTVITEEEDKLLACFDQCQNCNFTMCEVCFYYGKEESDN